jgi:hypothetical protein
MLLAILVSVTSGSAWDIPLDFHGGGFLGKYLNSDTTRYNMDASVHIYCTIARHSNSTFFMHYQDDLDMAEQKGGVSLDPRYAHYYITAGLDHSFPDFMTALYFVHDCVHDIDYDVEGTPVFNRFRFHLADANAHPGKQLIADDRLLWNLELGIYPHWKYHGWDINAGADYCYEGIASIWWGFFKYHDINFSLEPRFHITRGDSCWYHQHIAHLSVFLVQNDRRIGTQLAYNIWNNDPIKDPDRLWLLSLFVAF